MNHKRNMKKIASVIAITTPLFLSACGGGGGSSSATTPTPTPTPTPTQPTAQIVSTFTIPTIGVGTSVNLTATASSGLPVSYASTTPTVCTVSGSTITGVSLGNCKITANQAGNTSFSAAQTITESIIVGNQSINFNIPSLIVGESFPITATATSGYPVTLTSLTPSVCTVSGMFLSVVSTVAGICTVTATQAGNSQYAAALPVSITTIVDVANLAPVSGSTTVPSIFPQTGSMSADSSTTFAGIYVNPIGGVAFIDSANNIEYYDLDSSLFGSLQISGSAWTLNSSSVSYSNVTNLRTSTAATGSGSFVLKQSFTAAAQSFTTSPSLLSLVYSQSNGYAVTQSSLIGQWLLNTGTYQYQFSIDSAGAITGSATNTSGNFCSITGHILQADPNTSHNLFNVSFQASNAASSGSTCNDDLSIVQGLSAMRFFGATTVNANGIFRALSLIAHAPNGARIFLTMYKQP
jgi:hypothetical protein